MDDPWLVLRRGGLPLGAPVAAPPPTATELAAAVQAILASADEPRGRARDALAAFVLAWRRQWPRAFAGAFGAEGPGVLSWAERAVDDPNRYLKLSRIAMAHLATVL